MAQLTIEGHLTRGREIIEIFKMLGGKEVGYSGLSSHCYYYIDEYGNIAGTTSLPNSKTFAIYTLEEFLEKFPYKIGDKVTHSDYESPLEIVGMKWEDDSIRYEVYTNDYGYWFSVDELQPYKKEIVIDNLVTEEDFNNTPEVEQEYMKLAENLLNQLIEGTHWKCNEFDSQKMLAMFLKKNTPGVTKKDDSVIFNIPKGYEFAGVDDDNQKVVFTRIQPEYPKTFIEVLNFWHPDRQPEDDYQRCYKKDLIEKFQDLLYARDAYWKIAGNWKPLNDQHPTTYHVLPDGSVSLCCCSSSNKKLLLFPTEDMAIAFSKNFKDLIDGCQDLLN